jgi:hypothetical protein
MPNPIIFPSNVQWVGAAKETQWGSPITPPTMWWPVVDPKHAPNMATYVDDALRGNMAAVQAQVAGVRSDDVSYKTYLYLDSIFPHMLAMLGYPDTVSGSSDPYTHTTALLNTTDGQPPSYTLYLFNGAETWQVPGCKMSGLDLDIKPDGLVEVTPSWTGAPAVKVTNPANTPSTLAPMPGWNTAVTVGGAATSVYTAAKVSIKRADAGAIWTLSGSQSPYLMFVGALSVEGELTAVYQNLTGAPTDLANYLANTQPVMTVQTNPAGDVTHYLKLTMSKVGYSDVEVSAGGGYMQASAKIRAITNATDGLGTTLSPVKATLLNTFATSY